MKQGMKACGLFVALAVWAASGAWAGDGVVALQTAAASCADPTNTDRYIDCGNGTVTDNDTGLVWLKQANCFAKCSSSSTACTVDSDCPAGETCDEKFVDWFTAMEFVAGLSDKPAGSAAENQDCGLSDGSSPGEWRLPSVEEWEAMVANALGQGGGPNCTASPPTITNDSGLGCWVSGPSSFTGVVDSAYWSCTTNVEGPVFAWFVSLSNGGVGIGDKTQLAYVWPVRGGQ